MTLTTFLLSKFQDRVDIRNINTQFLPGFFFSSGSFRTKYFISVEYYLHGSQGKFTSIGTEIFREYI